MSSFSVSVIISTYNNPEWLEKTIWGYMGQSYKDFEIVIADDGSRDDTKQLVDSFKQNIFPSLKHVWHPDTGFEKTKILNKAILAASGDYLIFTDQDLVPRYDFVETHVKYAQKGYFLSGGCFKLSMELSKQLTKEDILSGHTFQIKWLRSQGLKLNTKWTKLPENKTFAKFMNWITPTKATWNGGNASGWRKDILQANGFNERMKYGGEDREFGERLCNMGIKSKQLRYSVICLHLDHERPYKNEEAIVENLRIRKTTRSEKIVRTPFGIEKL